MAENKEPKWEVVDSLPGEKARLRQSGAKPFYMRKTLWVGMGLGILVMVAFPPLLATVVTLVRRLAMAWWIWLGLGIYLFLRSSRKGPRRKP